MACEQLAHVPLLEPAARCKRSFHSVLAKQVVQFLEQVANSDKGNHTIRQKIPSAGTAIEFSGEHPLSSVTGHLDFGVEWLSKAQSGSTVCRSACQIPAVQSRNFKYRR